MSQLSRRLGLHVALASALLCCPPLASAADPVAVALEHLRSGGAGAGLAGSDLDEMVVTDLYETTRTGVSHVYLRQRIGEVEVHGTSAVVSIDGQDRVVFTGDRLFRGLPAISAVAPAWSAEDALEAAAESLGLAPAEPIVRLRELGGPHRSVVLGRSGISRDEIPAECVYYADGDRVRLSWNLRIREISGRHWWNLYVDATTGEILLASDWVRSDAYEVYPLPLTDPNDGDRALVFDVADPVASPFGWHDSNGVAGAEFTDTRGNNVFAQEDLDGDDLAGGRPDGGAALVFDFPVDLSQQPSSYLDAAITNLFYWNNVSHDIHYRYGFDEPAGNFQQNNYGAGGLAFDAVIADSQDGSAVNNAQFTTPPDGLAPRMDMFIWLQAPFPGLVVTTPPAVAGTYSAGGAQFGGGTQGLSGPVVRALDAADAAGPATTDACSPLTNAIAVNGNIAIVDRGTCLFVEKAVNVQAAGADAMIVVNDAGDDTITMAGIDPTVTIPSIFIGQTDGEAIVAQLGLGVQAQLTTPPSRASSLDNLVIAHEYGHGVSTRLTGGPSVVDCLSVAESSGMGEGWSDFWSLALTAVPEDEAGDPRGIAPYLLGQPPSGGLRNHPYSTDAVLSPLTYGDIPGLNQPHGIGEVWGGALWEMYWNLVAEYGFDPDLYEGSGGNNLALQLVMDALKLQPCSPTFVDGRDALLAADQAANGGENQCAIWEAFARRGVGVGADDGGSASSLAVVEDFEVPVACPEPGAPLLAAAALLGLAALRGASAPGRVCARRPGVHR